MTLFFFLLGENQTHKNNDWGKHTSELLNYLMTFYETNRTGLFSEVHTLGELFFPPLVLLFFFSAQRNKRGRERDHRRLVPVTVVLPCDWLQPVARLMSVFVSFLLPLLCALIGQV